MCGNIPSSRVKILLPINQLLSFTGSGIKSTGIERKKEVMIIIIFLVFYNFFFLREKKLIFGRFLLLFRPVFGHGRLDQPQSQEYNYIIVTDTIEIENAEMN